MKNLLFTLALLVSFSSFGQFNYDYIPKDFSFYVDDETEYYMDCFWEMQIDDDDDFPSYIYKGNLSSFDGKYELQEIYCTEDSGMPEFSVVNKYNKTVQQNMYVDVDIEYGSDGKFANSSYITHKFYNNGRNMLFGSFNIVTKRGFIKYKASGNWYMFSENGEYLAVGSPKGNNKLVNWRVFRNDNMKIVNELRKEIIANPMSYDFYNLLDDLKEQDNQLMDSELVDNLIFKYSDLNIFRITSKPENSAFLTERNGFALLDAGSKIKMFELYNKLNSY